MDFRMHGATIKIIINYLFSQKARKNSKKSRNKVVILHIKIYSSNLSKYPIRISAAAL
jgi:hypothetical protein